MSSHNFGALIQVESSSSPTTITTPPQAYRQTSFRPTEPRSTTTPPAEHELDEILQWGSKPLSGSSSTGIQPPMTPDRLEESRPVTPTTATDHQRVNQVTTSSLSATSPMNKWRLLAACMMNFGNGLNDSAPGPLIPRLQDHYHVSYSVVSLIFVPMAIGFLIAAPVNHSLERRFGWGRFYMIAMGLMVAGYVVLVCAPPFPVVVASFFPIGFGFACNLALCNVFCANLPNGTTALGFLHGSYGIGGIVGPLVATAMVSNGARWSVYYFVPLAMALANMLFSGWCFWKYEEDASAKFLAALERTASSRRAPTEASRLSYFKRAFGTRTALFGAVFIFTYQGAEVSISGWVVSFLIRYRGGVASSVGYTSSGFWGGITVGRFVLSYPAHKIGEKMAVVVLIAGCAAFELLVWLVPNIVGDAIAVSIVGLLLGPVYPCGTAIFSKLLPRDVQMSSLGFISAMGSSGGAAAPFFVGLLSQKVGTVVLHPIVIGLFAVMEVSWACLPRVVKRKE